LVAVGPQNATYVGLPAEPREALTNTTRVGVLSTQFIQPAENTNPSLDGLRVTTATHGTNLYRAKLVDGVKVEGRVVQTLVKDVKVTGVKKLAHLADNSRGVDATKAEQIANTSVTAPVGQNLFNREVKAGKRGESIDVPRLYVQMDVDRGSIAFVKLGTELLEHAPKVIKGLRNLVKQQRVS
jgi:hypothetical protein